MVDPICLIGSTIRSINAQWAPWSDQFGRTESTGTRLLLLEAGGPRQPSAACGRLLSQRSMKRQVLHDIVVTLEGRRPAHMPERRLHAPRAIGFGLVLDRVHGLDLGGFVGRALGLAAMGGARGPHRPAPGTRAARPLPWPSVSSGPTCVRTSSRLGDRAGRRATSSSILAASARLARGGCSLSRVPSPDWRQGTHAAGSRRSSTESGCAFPTQILSAASDTSARPASLAAAARISTHRWSLESARCARPMCRDGSDAAKRMKRRSGQAAPSDAAAVSGSRLSPASLAIRRDNVASDPAPRRTGRMPQLRHVALTWAARQSSWPSVNSDPTSARPRSAGDTSSPRVRRIASSRSARPASRRQSSNSSRSWMSGVPTGEETIAASRRLASSSETRASPELSTTLISMRGEDAWRRSTIPGRR